MDSLKGAMRTAELLQAAFLGGFAGINLCFIALYGYVSVTGRDLQFMQAILEAFADLLLLAGAHRNSGNAILACVGACFLTLVPGAVIGIGLNMRFRKRPVYRVITLLLRTVALFGILCFALLCTTQSKLQP